MKSIYTILLSAGLFCSGGLRAQSIIDISTHALDSLANSTYILNSNSPADMPLIDIEVFNRTSQTFFDSISFGYIIGRGGLISTYNTDNYTNSGIEFRSRGVQIGPNGSTTLSSLIFHFTSPEFVVGSSTVVIWPIAHSTHAVSLDSARVTVTLIAPSGIEHPELKDVKVFMVGSSLLVKVMLKMALET